MKTRHTTKIPAVLLTVFSTGAETLHFMKTRLRILNVLVLLCAAFGATSVFGQVVYTWTGAANRTNLSTTGNWTTNGVDAAVTLPTGATQDTVLWDNLTQSNLLINYNNSPGLPGTGFGTSGINLTMTPNQTNSVTIVSTASATVGVFGMTNFTTGAQFILGDVFSANPAHLVVVGRPAGAIHYYVNNSTAPTIFNSQIELQAGGRNAYTIDFDRTVDSNVRTC